MSTAFTPLVIYRVHLSGTPLLFSLVILSITGSFIFAFSILGWLTQVICSICEVLPVDFESCFGHLDFRPLAATFILDNFPGDLQTSLLFTQSSALFEILSSWSFQVHRSNILHLTSNFFPLYFWLGEVTHFLPEWSWDFQLARKSELISLIFYHLFHWGFHF